MKRHTRNAVRPGTEKAVQSLAQSLKTARLARNITLSEMALRAGISVPTASRIETGDPAVSMAAWMSCLGVMGLLEQVLKAVIPADDALGEGLRRAQLRKRARRSEGLAEYDF